jgi:antitoxin CcdA
VTDTWTNSIREPAYAADAPKQTISLTINSDLMTRIKALGINASRVAETALAAELERHRREALAADISADLAASSSYVAKHGSFGDMVREHYRSHPPEKS